MPHLIKHRCLQLYQALYEVLPDREFVDVLTCQEKLEADTYVLKPYPHPFVLRFFGQTFNLISNVKKMMTGGCTLLPSEVSLYIQTRLGDFLNTIVFVQSK